MENIFVCKFRSKKFSFSSLFYILQVVIFYVSYPMQETVSELVKQFFVGLGIQLTSVDTQFDKTDVNIRIETPDSALIIWMHGKSLESFSHLLGRMVERLMGAFVHVHLEVNDYMKSKDERLFRFLDSKIAFAMSTGKAIRIPNLTSYERKKAHGYISEKNITWLSTHSDGEWTERALMLEYTGPIQQVDHTSSPSRSTSPWDDLSEDGVGI